MLSADWRGECLCETRLMDYLIGTSPLAHSDNPDTYESPNQALTHLSMRHEVLHLGCP
jgi:hypothetical protein